MAIQFNYGGFIHPFGEMAFAKIQRTVIWSQTQRQNVLRETWSLKGKIIRQGIDAQTQIFSYLGDLRNAYSVNGQSAGMSGTALQMDNSSAIGGVIVTDRVSHGELMGAETATYLHFTVGLQMDSFLSRLTDLLSYQEQVTFSDINGGAHTVDRVPIEGLPIIQSITTNSFYFATQSGSASSRDPGILPEDLLFPGDLQGRDGARQITYSSPKMERGQATEYGVSWKYEYRGIAPIIGRPHARG